MRVDQLPSPGLYSNAPRLAFEAAKAISHAEITLDLAGGTRTAEHDELQAFFQACVDTLAAFPAPAP